MTSPTSQPTPALICPKCQGEMRQYERNGVTIDQCAECRGIFLDRGELEALLDANDAYNARPAGQQQGTPNRDDKERVGGDEGSSHGGGGHGQQGRKRRGGFLGGLFDD